MEGGMRKRAIIQLLLKEESSKRKKEYRGPPAPAPQIKKVKNEKLISSVHGSGIPGPGLKRRNNFKCDRCYN